MTKFLFNRVVTGRWSFYIDSDYLWAAGRIPNDRSVVYALGPFVAEHTREVSVDRAWYRAVRRWQDVREQATAYASIWSAGRRRQGESGDAYSKRVEDKARSQYEDLAAAARARGELVPTWDELRVPGPTREPTNEPTSAATDTPED